MIRKISEIPTKLIDNESFVIGYTTENGVRVNAKFNIGTLLDENGNILANKLPSFVDDVIEGYFQYNGNTPILTTFYSDSACTKAILPESNKIYVDSIKNLTYRWSGNAYVEISKSLALGETDTTAYRGDYGKVAYDHAITKGSTFSGFNKLTTNAHGHVTGATPVTKSDLNAVHIDWSSVDNTPSSFTPSSHTHYNLKTEADNRNVSTTPNDYSNEIKFSGLKTASAIGDPAGTGGYYHLVGLRGWGTYTGGKSTELAFHDSGLFMRKGSTTSWETWRSFLTSFNIETTYTNCTTNDKIPGAKLFKDTCDTRLGAVQNGSYIQMRNPNGASDWIQTTSYGLIPCASGNATNGHSGLGTSGWYFNSAYVQDVYNTKNHIGDCVLEYDSTRKCLNFNFV